MKRISENSSASHIDFYNLFWIFIIGCVLGVVSEILYSFANTGLIDYPKGVIYGPFNPVYGFGVVFLTLVLHPIFHKRWYIIFILSMLIGGGFEFFSSCFQQFTTGTVSWQYQQLPLNLYGRTSLMFSFYWGILGVFWVKEIDPLIAKAVEKTPQTIGRLITAILIVFMIFDMTISLLAVKRWDERINNIPANNVVDKFLDNTYPDQFLANIYPGITHVSHQ